jgi:DNA-binding CsgD family transcriptional regulator
MRSRPRVIPRQGGERARAVGCPLLNPWVEGKFNPNLNLGADDVRQAAADVGGMTTSELEVLKLIATGLSNAEIAATLVVSVATVKTHVNHIFQKAGARDRARAVRNATSTDSPDRSHGVSVSIISRELERDRCAARRRRRA